MALQSWQQWPKEEEESFVPPLQPALPASVGAAAPGIALQRSRQGRRAGEHVLYCSNLDWAQPKTFTSVVIT